MHCCEGVGVSVPTWDKLGVCSSFFSSPVWTLRPQLPLQDPFLPSEQMFSGHLSGFVGWAALWILVFSRILAQQFLSTLSSLLFSRCFSKFFLAHLFFTILSRELA